MSGNTSAKKALIKRYGPKCFIESLKLRDTSHITYKGKAQKARMKALTYHHIRERVFGGRATVENGALLSAENHAWFNRQPREAQRIMNRMFQAYKRFRDGIDPGKKFERIKVEYVDLLETGIEVKAGVFAPEELQRIAREKEERRQRKELQQIRKEWEDR